MRKIMYIVIAAAIVLLLEVCLIIFGRPHWPNFIKDLGTPNVELNGDGYDLIIYEHIKSEDFLVNGNWEILGEGFYIFADLPMAQVAQKLELYYRKDAIPSFVGYKFEALQESGGGLKFYYDKNTKNLIGIRMRN